MLEVTSAELLVADEAVLPPRRHEDRMALSKLDRGALDVERPFAFEDDVDLVDETLTQAEMVWAVNQSLRRALMSFAPPFLLSWWRSLRSRKEQLSEQQSALRVQHELRNRGCGKDAIVLRDGVRLKLHPDSRKGFEHFCYRDPQMVDELDGFLEHTADRLRLLDVGASDGIFSLAFAANRSDKAAFALDPSPIAFAKLVHNIDMNRATNITAIQCALSSEPGALAMHYEWEHLVAGDTAGPVVRVEKQTGDSLCSAFSFAPDVIKIDVEGHETDVVRGLRETILAHHPLLFLELQADWVVRREVDGMALSLRDLGYPVAETSTAIIPIERVPELTGIWRLVLRPEQETEPDPPSQPPPSLVRRR